MSDRNPTAPVPGPARLPGPSPLTAGPRPGGPAAGPAGAPPAGPADARPADALLTLADRPVAEHVPVLEAELERLQRRLATVDQL